MVQCTSSLGVLLRRMFAPTLELGTYVIPLSNHRFEFRVYTLVIRGWRRLALVFLAGNSVV